MNEPLPPPEPAEHAHWSSRRPYWTLLVVVAVVYARVFSAHFVSFDDDLHVYDNPFLNPPTLESVARLWQEPYERLYVPLAYTIFAAVAGVARVPSHMDSSVGHAVSLDPTAFHAVSVAFHVANAWLCFFLIRRLTRGTRSALVGALLFAVHPLQVESVGWISELRGLTSGCFALGALAVFLVARQSAAPGSAASRKWLALSLPLVLGAVLCKPSAVVLPLVALAFDRCVLETSWRRALALAGGWAVLVAPFVFVTRSLQPVTAAADVPWWQRPFVAGDALSFYVWKTFVPLDLGVDYGRTPSEALSHAWGYLAWLVPLGLLALAYRYRQSRPLSYLGALLFFAFLLPTSGLMPFSFQAYSTVADRYAYLALFGAALVAADVAEHFGGRKPAVPAVAVVLAALAVLTVLQTGLWETSSALLRHALEVNPNAAFAYNNLGDVALGNGDVTAALADYQACVRIDPTRVKAYVNLAEIYASSDEPAQAEQALTRALEAPALTADDYSNLGIVLMKMNQPSRALDALSKAVGMDPKSPVYLYNEANAFSATGRFEQAESAFKRCLALAPTLAGAHTGLGIVYAETQRLPSALEEFRAAVRLAPGDPAALDNLKKAEALLAQPAP